MNKEEMYKLYNTLSSIQTKGSDTKTMAACLTFLEQKIAECESQPVKADCEVQ